MTIAAAWSRLNDVFAFHGRSNGEQQNTAARPPNLRSDRLSAALCFGAIAIGIIALAGYVLGNASIASLGTNGKPVAAVAALALIMLGGGLLALRSPAPAGLLMARRAALGVIVLMAADLLSAAFSRHIEKWKVWAARGGVHLHAYPIATLLFIALASALILVTMRRDLAGHVIASAVLTISAVFSIAYFLQVPSFLDQSRLIAPAAGATWGLVLISAAEVLARPRGWVIPLLSRTSAGMIARLLLLSAFVMPVLALWLREMDSRWFGPEESHTVFVTTHAFFGAAFVLAVGALLLKRESDRVRLATFVDSSDDAIVGKSSAGFIESWNAGAETMYGYTAAEAMGRPITMLLPPERHEEVPLLLERAARGEHIDPFEAVRVAKDGRRIDVRLSVSPILDYEGNVVGTSTIAHDITKRKQEQEALKRSEERLQLAQRAGGIGHFSWDIQNNIAEWSDELLALYSLAPGSIGEKYESFTDRVFPDDLPAVEAATQSAMASGEFFCDFRVVWPDASIHWLHSRAKVFFSDYGTPLRMVGVNMDITERKQAEEALRNREGMLQRIFDILPVGLWFADKDGKLLRGNPAGVEIWGVEPLVGPSEYGIFKARRLPSGEDVAPDDWALVHAIRDRVTIVDELLEIDAFDGKKKTILNYTAPVLDAQGDLQGAIVVNQDITELIRTEEALRRSEAALKEGQRIANVGHWEWSTVTGVAMWSDEVYRILGIPIGSVTPSYELYFGMIDPKDRRKLEEEIARVLASSSGGDVDIDLRMTTPAGAKLVVSERVFVDRDRAGNVVGFHGTCQDITARVATEQALRESEAALAEAQQIAHIGSWILYPESGDGHASAETFRIFALDPRPLVALQLFLDRVHEDDRARVGAAFALSIQTGTLDVEGRIVTPQGTRVAHAVAMKRETGEPRLSMIGTIQDVTERKATEEALWQRTESLERSNIELERFNRLAVGRELRMIELKQQINDLCAKSGQPAPYVLSEERALAKETS
jgi:PAS domain S-box-containing protein